MACFNMSAMRVNLPRPTICRRTCSTSAPALFSSFSGLRLSDSPLRLAGGDASRQLGPQNGATLFAMRHQKRVPRLGRPADQRKALIRGLVTEVLRHGKITTTKVKAKAIRKYIDKMVVLAKLNTLHARRQVLAFVYDKEVVSAMFDKIPERYADRSSGFCRVVAEPRLRRGDAAQMAIIELV